MISTTNLTITLNKEQAEKIHDQLMKHYDEDYINSEEISELLCIIEDFIYPNDFT